MAGDPFRDTLAAAMRDFTEHGYDSPERLALWQSRLLEAMERSMLPKAAMDRMMREVLVKTFKRLVDDEQVLRRNPGIARWTLDKLRPELRAELDRRIVASTELIKLNKAEEKAATLRRFAGWATSIPKGGSADPKMRKEGERIRKHLSGLSFRERRVFIDQGHKLESAVNRVVAEGGGAIAGIWRSNWRQANYDYREDHKERDGAIYLVKDSWAVQRGLVKLAGRQYMDAITEPGEEPYCLPADAHLTFADGLEVAYRRWYSGQLTTLVTATGKSLRLTPKHPVLTVQGWVAAKSIKEGDYVIEVAQEFILGNKADPYNGVTRFDDAFGALSKTWMPKVLGMGTKHFHGDGVKGNVDVIRTARPLTLGVVPFGYKRVDDEVFAEAAIAGHFGGTFGKSGWSSLASSDSVVRSLGQTLTAFYSFALHAMAIRFADAAYGNTMSLQEQVNSLGCDAVSIGQQSSSFTSFIPFAKAARVVGVGRELYTGHVYNLETVGGWYASNGIITHNCRCYYRYLYNLRDLPADMLTAKGKEALAAARSK